MRGRVGRRLAVAALALLCARAARALEPVTPPEHRRGAEQTFLTFPEWFLVHSPAEYAAYVSSHQPSGFPFWGHVGQFWRSYAAVTRATKGCGCGARSSAHHSGTRFPSFAWRSARFRTSRVLLQPCVDPFGLQTNGSSSMHARVT